jgi:hypothetical protein
MRKWNLPLTYEPKIRPVIHDIIGQTIRIVKEGKRKKEVGDLVRFYIWKGRPYRSKRETVTGYHSLKEVWGIDIKPDGIMTYAWDGYPERFYQWAYLDWLAVLDGIIPPTGEALRDVLISKNKIPEEGIEAQILRW